MKNKKEIVSYNEEYGKVIFKFNQMIDKKGLNVNQVSKITGIKHQVIKKWYQGEISKIDVDVLAKLCYVLECKISDVIEYIEETKITKE